MVTRVKYLNGCSKINKWEWTNSKNPNSNSRWDEQSRLGSLEKERQIWIQNNGENDTTIINPKNNPDKEEFKILKRRGKP